MSAPHHQGREVTFTREEAVELRDVLAAAQRQEGAHLEALQAAQQILERLMAEHGQTLVELDQVRAELAEKKRLFVVALRTIEAQAGKEAS